MRRYLTLTGAVSSKRRRENIMREIICIKQSSVTEQGRTILQEWRYHGRVDESGVFRLLACSGKRVPMRASGEDPNGKLSWRKGAAA